MKWYQLLLLVANGLAALYFLYMGSLHLFVYVQNKAGGHYASSFEAVKYLVVGGVLSVIALGGWGLVRYSAYTKAGTALLAVPLALVALYVLFGIMLLISSGGRWN